MYRSLILKCFLLKLILLVIKLLMLVIILFKNLRFDGLDVLIVNVIGSGLGGFKL